jgi:hypothetical protein
MRHSLTSMALVAGLAAGVAPALAAAPQPVDATIEWQCPEFVATLRVTGSSKSIPLPGGGFIFASPNQRVTVTAPDGNTATYVITGASHVETLSNGNSLWTSTGRNLLLVPEANGHPSGLFLTSGTVNFILGPNGEEVALFSGPGKVVDVCQALSS